MNGGKKISLFGRLRLKKIPLVVQSKPIQILNSLFFKKQAPPYKRAGFALSLKAKLSFIARSVGVYFL
jgi:hypothetical protein